jgi:hypothetical protein
VKTRERFVGLASVAGLVILGSSLRAQTPAPAPVSGPAAAPAPATASAGPKKIYTAKTMFRLPVQIKDPRERARLQEVQLYVKAGGPAGSWALNQKGKPDTDHFDYLVPQDGEYWFRLVTVDNAGRMNPTDISKTDPSLVVVVDTHKPECEVKAVQGLPGEFVLQCDIRDENPDPMKTKLEHMSADKSWVPFPAHSTMVGCFQVSDLNVLKYPVRATVCDRAGNCMIREFMVTPAGLPAAVAAMPVGTPAAPTTPVQVGSMPSPISPAVASATTPVPNGMNETVSQKPEAAGNVPTLMVKSRKLPLEYQFENSTPARVVVWVTSDGGNSWRHLCDDPDRKSPVEIELPGEGRYGVCLAACPAGEGECKPPSKGDTPDCWVEVDTTAPSAQILAVRAGTTKDEAGTILITYTAADKNLKADGIDLFYATKHEGPWLPIAKGLKNDGNYRWHYPADLCGSDLFIKMDVTDQAGNVAHCDGVQPPAEASRPRAKVIGVGGSSTPNPVPPSGN